MITDMQDEEPVWVFGFWKPVIGSIIIGVLALALTFLFAGAGHGTYLPAKLLFPYTMLSTVLFGSISDSFVIIAVVQFPVYGLILGLAARTYNFGFAAKVIAVVHVVCSVLCLLLVGENFS